jgi:hypothetical protein
MGQQAGIVVLIDIDAAVEAGHLEGNTYLIDNQKWMGSTGEGTGHLITAIDGVRARAQVEPQVLNWVAYGIAALPPSLPKSFFGRRFVGPVQPEAVGPSARRTEVPGFVPRLLDITGNEIARSNVVPEAAAQARSNVSKTSYPTPQIVSITGEAVDKGVMFPAQYGSPDLFSDGLYWSASVNTNIVGIFPYTMNIVLYYPSKQAGESTGGALWDWVIMPCEARVNVTNSYIINGFTETPAMIPSF